MKTKKLAYWASVTVLGIVLGVSLQFVKAWSEPTATAPNANVEAPINASSVGQMKTGPLQVSGFRNVGATVLDGNVGVGTLAPNTAKGTNGNIDVNDIYIRSVDKWASDLSGASTTGYCSEAYVYSYYPVLGWTWVWAAQKVVAPAAALTPNIWGACGCSSGTMQATGSMGNYRYWNCVEN